MYTKDFASLLQLLDIAQQSGTLIVTCEGEPWQAWLHLREGKVGACSLASVPDGRLLMSGSQAIAWLSCRGELQWRLEAYQPPPAGLFDAPLAPRPAMGPLPGAPRSGWPGQGQPLLPPTPPVTRLVPRRIAHPSHITLWSRDVRHVFALIDGVKTLEEIARLLRKPPEEVLPLVRELASQGFIRIEEQS